MRGLVQGSAVLGGYGRVLARRRIFDAGELAEGESAKLLFGAVRCHPLIHLKI